MDARGVAYECGPTSSLGAAADTAGDGADAGGADAAAGGDAGGAGEPAPRAGDAVLKSLEGSCATLSHTAMDTGSVAKPVESEGDCPAKVTT